MLGRYSPINYGVFTPTQLLNNYLPKKMISKPQLHYCVSTIALLLVTISTSQAEQIKLCVNDSEVDSVGIRQLDTDDYQAVMINLQKAAGTTLEHNNINIAEAIK